MEGSLETNKPLLALRDYMAACSPIAASAFSVPDQVQKLFFARDPRMIGKLCPGVKILKYSFKWIHLLMAATLLSQGRVAAAVGPLPAGPLPRGHGWPTVRIRPALRTKAS